MGSHAENQCGIPSGGHRKCSGQRLGPGAEPRQLRDIAVLRQSIAACLCVGEVACKSRGRVNQMYKRITETSLCDREEWQHLGGRVWLSHPEVER